MSEEKGSNRVNWSLFWSNFKFESRSRKILFFWAGFELSKIVLAFWASFNRYAASISKLLSLLVSWTSFSSRLSISELMFVTILSYSSAVMLRIVFTPRAFNSSSSFAVSMCSVSACFRETIGRKKTVVFVVLGKNNARSVPVIFRSAMF